MPIVLVGLCRKCCIFTVKIRTGAIAKCGQDCQPIAIKNILECKGNSWTMLDVLGAFNNRKTYVKLIDFKYVTL